MKDQEFVLDVNLRIGTNQKNEKMQNNKNAQELLNEWFGKSGSQSSQRKGVLINSKSPSNSSPKKIFFKSNLPICAFKFTYSLKQENFAEKLVNEINEIKANKRGYGNS